MKLILYVWIVWIVVILWNCLVDILVWIFDVIGFIVNIVLEVDLEFGFVIVF